jgi:hypothetical protein
MIVTFSASCRPTVAQGNAVLMELMSVTELCGLKQAERFLDVASRFLQDFGQQGGVRGGFRRRAGRMRPDHEGGVSKQADTAKDSARHDDIDDFLNEGLLRRPDQLGHAGMHLAAGARAQLRNRLFCRAAKGQRIMVQEALTVGEKLL